MNPTSGFLNLHPFFVHVPLVLLPLAAVMGVLGRKAGNEGFETATRLITLAGAIGGVTAVFSGWAADGSFHTTPALRALIEQHEVSGLAAAGLAAVAAGIAVAQLRGAAAPWLLWARTGLLAFAAVAVVIGGHQGAQLVYLHGAAVVPVAQQEN